MFEHREAERRQINKQACGGMRRASVCAPLSATGQARSGERRGAALALPHHPRGWGLGQGEPHGTAQQPEGREDGSASGKEGE